MTRRLVRVPALALLVAFLPLAAGLARAQAPQAIWSMPAHAGAINGVAFSPDGKLIATAGADHGVKLWRARDGAFLGMLANYTDEATTVAFSADGTLLASGSLDRTASLTDVASGAVDCFQTTTGFVRDLALSPDGATLALALGYSSNELHLVNVASCQLAAIIHLHWGTIWTTAYSADGSWLASAGADGRTLVFQAPNHQLILDLGVHENDVSAVAFAPDGTKVASSGAWDHRVLVWSVPAGGLLLDLAAPGDFLHGLDISRDGRLLAACGEQWPAHGTIRMWRLDDGAPLASYAQGVGLNVPSIAFAPNGRTFAFGRNDGVLVLAARPSSLVGPQ